MFEPLITNPLLALDDLIRFDAIVPEHVTPAIARLLADARAVVTRLEDKKIPATWTDFVEPLVDATERLSRAWGAVGHLNAVADTPVLRVAYNDNLPKVTEFWTALSQNQGVFDQYRRLSRSAEHAHATAARKRVVEHALRDFRLGGAELSDIDKARFAAIEDELAKLAQKFSENVLDATNDYALDIDDASELLGLPDDALAAARARAQEVKATGCRFTLHLPSYLAVLQFAEHRALRETLYAAYVKRASEFGKPEQDNTETITRTLALRAEAARLLGYPDYASVSLVSKMAETPDQVLDFLDDLAQRAKPYGELDMAELRSFARESLGITTLEAWDIAFASEKLREHRYSFSEHEVKQYFPEPKVLEGLFRVVETLFSVRIEERIGTARPPVWHPDVKFFDVKADDGSLLAQFYLDLYARAGKRSGAWMASARSRRRLAGGVTQTPIAFLTCNFSAPMANTLGADRAAPSALRSALFSHAEVTTLFHEFGHGLHHMLTQVDEAGVAGIRGVEWDAVELPSQFMENFCWEWDVVRHMTAHVDTGAPIPKALFDKMLAAKNFQAGLQILRQIELATFDMLLHSSFVAGGSKSVLDLIAEVRERIAVVVPPAYNRFPNQFSHIFAGGYAAGYYGYKWAEVLSADAYAQFEEDGVLDPGVGARFRDQILGVGGSRPALDSFSSFRGRAPSIEALLRHNGLTVLA